MVDEGARLRAQLAFLLESLMSRRGRKGEGLEVECWVDVGRHPTQCVLDVVVGDGVDFFRGIQHRGAVVSVLGP